MFMFASMFVTIVGGIGNIIDSVVRVNFVQTSVALGLEDLASVLMSDVQKVSKSCIVFHGNG